jgi:hypothetical protein
MKKFLITLAAVLCVLPARSALAAVEYRNLYIHGNSCVSITNGQAAVYSQWGVQAPGAAAIDVTCPIIIQGGMNWTPLTSAWMEILGYNRAGQGQMFCTLTNTDFDGTQQIVGRADMGYNAFNIWAFQYGVAQITPGSEVLFLRCHLPGTTAPGAISHLTSVWIQVGFGQ